MYDYGAAFKKLSETPQSFVLDIDTPGWKPPYRVSVDIYKSGRVEINKVDAFLEEFQVYKPLVLEDFTDFEAFEKFRDKISDWHNWYQYNELNRRRERKVQFNNDDPNPAA